MKKLQSRLDVQDARGNSPWEYYTPEPTAIFLDPGFQHNGGQREYMGDRAICHSELNQ